MNARPQPFLATRPLTSLEIGEQSAGKPLGKFGSRSVRKPVSEGIAGADAQDGAVRL